MRKGARAVKFLLPLLFASASTQAASTLHPEVQAALDYTVVPHQCEPPRRDLTPGSVSIGSGSTLPGTARTSTGGANDTRTTSGGDATELRRRDRELAAWRGCIEDYKRGLLDDFTRLKASARHGLTLEQANRIAENLLAIQNVIMSETASPDGS